MCVVLGAPTPPQEPSPQPVVERNPEEVKRKAERKRIKQEFITALKREGMPWASLSFRMLCVRVMCKQNDLRLCAEHAVKLRLELIKAHALRTMSSLQQRAEQVYGNMEEWLRTRFLSEMNRWEEDRWRDGWVSRDLERMREHCISSLGCNCPAETNLNNNWEY